MACRSEIVCNLPQTVFSPCPFLPLGLKYDVEASDPWMYTFLSMKIDKIGGRFFTILVHAKYKYLPNPLPLFLLLLCPLPTFCNFAKEKYSPSCSCFYKFTIMSPLQLSRLLSSLCLPPSSAPLVAKDAPSRSAMPSSIAKPVARAKPTEA